MGLWPENGSSRGGSLRNEGRGKAEEWQTFQGHPPRTQTRALRTSFKQHPSPPAWAVVLGRDERFLVRVELHGLEHLMDLLARVVHGDGFHVLLLIRRPEVVGTAN